MDYIDKNVIMCYILDCYYYKEVMQFVKYPKYSSIIFQTNRSIAKKSKIAKLEKKYANDFENEILKAEKKDYVSAIVGEPEFDEALIHFSDLANNRGNFKDKSTLTEVSNKMSKGDLGYEDLDKIQELCDNNYKYLFTNKPVCSDARARIVFGGVLTFFAIVLRCNYDEASSDSILIFLLLFNLFAISYTIYKSYNAVCEKINGWLCSNDMPKSMIDKFLKITSRKMVYLILIITLAVVVAIAVSCACGYLSTTNDILALISLGFSILFSEISEALAIHYEQGIYHNNK